MGQYVTIQHANEILDGPTYIIHANHLTDNFAAIISALGETLNTVTTNPQTVNGPITFAGPLTLTASNTFSLIQNFTSGINIAVTPDPTNSSNGDIYYSTSSGDFVGVIAVSAISGATNASPIVITTTNPHNLTINDTVYIKNVLGNTAANGTWNLIVPLTPTTFRLVGSTGNGAYVSGGTVSVAKTFASQSEIQQFPTNYHGSACPVANTTSSAGTGTVTVSNSSTTITFSNSQSGLAGSLITTAGFQTRVIVSGSGTSWTVNSNFQNNESTVSWSKTSCTGLSMASIAERDSLDTVNIQNNASCSASLTAAAGLGGLDTGSVAANTYYYLYAVTNGFSVGLILSTVNESVSGTISNSVYAYTAKRQLPIWLLSNGGSLAYPFYIGGGWPGRPIVYYSTSSSYFNAVSSITISLTNVLNGGTSASFASLSLSSFVPPISKEAILTVTNNNTGSNFLAGRISPDGIEQGVSFAPVAAQCTQNLTVKTDSSQSVKYIRDNGGGGAIVDVMGAVVTEVN